MNTVRTGAAEGGAGNEDWDEDEDEEGVRA